MRSRSLRLTLAGLPLVALMLLSAARPTPTLAQWTCYGGGTAACAKVTACTGHLWWKVCLEVTHYWTWKEPPEEIEEVK